MAGWGRAVVEAFREANRKGLSLVAAGVAFYMLLSMFPGVAVFVSVYGLIADPATIQTLFDDLTPYAPPEALAFLRDLVDKTLASGGAQLGATAVISFLIAVWSAGSAVRALMTALQLAFPSSHQYGAILFYALSFLFTLMGVILIALVIAILVFVPIGFEAVRSIDAADQFETVWELLRRLEPLILPSLAAGILCLIYWLGAVRQSGRLKNALLAAIATTALWLGVSRILAIYVAQFADLDAVYGPFAAVAGLMLWFWISVFLLLLGAELAAALSRSGAAPQKAASPSDG